MRILEPDEFFDRFGKPETWEPLEDAMRTEHGRRLEDDGRTDCERWKAAAIQAKDDLRSIEAAFREATPAGEDGPNPPIGPGHVFAEWTSPANTMRWIEEMERQADEPTGGEDGIE